MMVFVAEESPDLAARLLERLQAVPELTVIGVARNTMEAIRVIPVLEPDREASLLVEYCRQAARRRG